MANQHDIIVKDLLGNRELSVSFLQQYMPQELVSLVDWTTVVLDSANVEHVRQTHKRNNKQKEQSDLAFLFKFKDGKQGAIICHIEHQNDNDKTILLRTKHYQTSYLLDFLKRNKNKGDLPVIYSLIYYTNKKEFSHSFDIYDYFQNPELARKYAFRTEFIDLVRMSDEEIEKHGKVSGLESVLKYVSLREVDGNLEMLAQDIETYDQVIRISLLKYLSSYSDLEENVFYDKILHIAPKLKGDIMTVAEQWELKGVEKGKLEGLQQGKLEGLQQGKLETARKLLSMGLSIEEIQQATGLTHSDIQKLYKQDNH
ncbi:Rpn family recombination-promoting nuclease/putative transposase [Francisella sp. TX07-6608]|uniref:Rpn family recombination-promoting nuclease/putative transposase n=1 Tax=Francisella sp. TX07-6608 TaxID=573568 RepID=UPI0008F988DA|nr:Rpn family recombination-promoting nuclease/putative transposase [Francisella sp. TX07-6608]OIN84946.1 hypothetical protein KX00_2214 [Francisella sp. TX07-6608]